MNIQEQKQEDRRIKLERIILLQEEYEESIESKYMTFIEYTMVKKFREEKEKKKPSKQVYENYYKTIIFRNKNINISKYSTDEDIKNYLDRLEKEFDILNKYDTFTLLNKYRKRFRYHYSFDTILFEGKDYLTQSFKFVLDEREHIPIRKKDRDKLLRVKYQGKKDKNNGRKNPTNRK